EVVNDLEHRRALAPETCLPRKYRETRQIAARLLMLRPVDAVRDDADLHACAIQAVSMPRQMRKMCAITFCSVLADRHGFHGISGGRCGIVLSRELRQNFLQPRP